jgi:hypothetical protein
VIRDHFLAKSSDSLSVYQKQDDSSALQQKIVASLLEFEKFLSFHHCTADELQ